MRGWQREAGCIRMSALPTAARERIHAWTTAGTAGTPCPKRMERRGQSCALPRCEWWAGICVHPQSPVRDIPELRRGRRSA